MDYPQTPAWEAGVRKAVTDGWADFRTARTPEELTRRLPQFEARMAEALADAFDDIYEEAIIGILLWMMAEDPGFQTVVDSFREDPAMAYQMGQRRAARLAGEMAQTNRRLLTDRMNTTAVPAAPGVPAPRPGDEQGSFADWVQGTLFGEPRADMIAITETTGALSEAELESANIATTAAGSGLIVDARWFTADDERVCPVCEPLHNTAYAVFSIYFPGGPPAHPRCRCRLEWRVRNRARRESYRLSVPLLEFDASKHPRGPDGRFIGKMSGVDFGTWNMNHPSAKGAVKKIGELETAARKGDWDTFEKLMYKPKKGDAAKPNGYQKMVLKAQANILAKKPELDAKVAAKAAKKGDAAPAVDPAQGAELLAKANAELAATGQAKVAPVAETKGGSGETKGGSGETKQPKPTTGTGKWEAIGGKLGTEEGGVFKSPDGVKHYVKKPANPARAHNEVLAISLYQAAGAGVVEGAIVDTGDGKPSVATKWVDSEKSNWGDVAARKKAAEDFAVHAWLNNWDAVGAGSENPMDNIRMVGGKPVLVDAGGSLDYSGMGGSGKKVFKADAPEWESLRSKSINPTMAKVFGDMTPEELKASATKLASIDDDKIRSLVEKHHGGTSGEKQAMIDTLISRRDAILKKAGVPKGEPISKAAAKAGVPSHGIGGWAGKQADKMKALADAGDVAGLQAFSVEGNPLGSTYKAKLLNHLGAQSTGIEPVAPAHWHAGTGYANFKLDASAAEVANFGQQYTNNTWDEGDNEWLTGTMQGKKGGAPTEADLAKLAKYQLAITDANPDNYEVATLSLGAVVPSQAGENYENESSKGLAKHITKFLSSERAEDYAPILVDPSGVILDGNHRHAARKMAGVDEIPVLKPKEGTYHEADKQLTRLKPDAGVVVVTNKFGGITGIEGAISSRTIDGVAKSPKDIKTLLDAVHPDDREALIAKFKARGIETPAVKAAAEKLPAAFGSADPGAIPPPPKVTSAANAGAQKKFDAIAAAAATGDIAAVEAIATKADAKQTYAKKHHQYKMAVLEAMKNGAMPTDEFKAKAPAPVVLEMGTEEHPAQVKLGGEAAPDASIEVAKLTLPPVTISPTASPTAYKHAVDLYELGAKGDIEGIKAYQAAGPLSGVYKDQLIAHFDKAQLAAKADASAAKAAGGDIPEPPKYLSKAPADMVDVIQTLGKKGEFEKLIDLGTKGFNGYPPSVQQYHGQVVAALQAAKPAPGGKAAPAAAPAKVKLPSIQKGTTGGPLWKMQDMLKAASAGDLAKVKQFDDDGPGGPIKKFKDKLVAALEGSVPPPPEPVFTDQTNKAFFDQNPSLMGDLLELKAMGEAGDVAGIKKKKLAGTGGFIHAYQKELLHHFADYPPAPKPKVAIPKAPSLTLPASKAAVKQIQALAKAGDIAGLHAFETGALSPMVKSYHDKVKKAFEAAGVKAPVKVDPAMLPASPTFQTSNAKLKAENEATVGQLQKLAVSMNVAEIEKVAASHPSPKMKAYAQSLVSHLQDLKNPVKPADFDSAAPGQIPHPGTTASYEAKSTYEAVKKGDYSGLMYQAKHGSGATKEYATKLYSHLAKTQPMPSIPQMGKVVKPPAPTLSGSYAAMAKTVPDVYAPGVAKLYDWGVAGDVGGVPKDVPEGKWYTWDQMDKQWEKGQKQYGSLTKFEQAAIRSYTGGGYTDQNAEFRFKPKAKWSAETRATYDALHKAAVPLEPGQMIGRKMNLKDGGAKLEVGKVVVEMGAVSCAGTEASWSGNIHWKLTAAPGAKALPAKYFSSSDSKDSKNESNENEFILPPGTRLMITKKDTFASHTEVHALILPLQ